MTFFTEARKYVSGLLCIFVKIMQKPLDIRRPMCYNVFIK